MSPEYFIGTLSASWVPSSLSYPNGSSPGQDYWYYRDKCPSAGSCVAAGSYENSAGQTFGALATLTAGLWTTSSAPLPSGAHDSFWNQVDCSTATSCFVVGGYVDSSGVTRGLIETNSSGSWAYTAAPMPPDATQDEALDSVACPSATTCVAVRPLRGRVESGARRRRHLREQRVDGERAADPRARRRRSPIGFVLGQLPGGRQLHCGR